MSEPIKSDTITRIREIPNLPALPSLGQHILSEVNNDDVDIEKLSSLIEQDPALLARIIGIANSAYFGCPEPIYSVSTAIVQVLGLSLVKSLACSIILSNQFKVSQCRHFKLSFYWYKAMMTALLSKYMQKGLGVKTAYTEDQAYLGGLLHNLGELVLVHAFPLEMERIYANTNAGDSENIAKQQEEAVGLSFMEAGSILAAKWHLPDDTRHVLLNYDAPSYRGEDWQLVNIIGLASYMCHHEAEGLPQSPSMEAWRTGLDISEEFLIKAGDYINSKAPEVQGLADVLAMD